MWYHHRICGRQHKPKRFVHWHSTDRMILSLLYVYFFLQAKMRLYHFKIISLEHFLTGRKQRLTSNSTLLMKGLRISAFILLCKAEKERKWQDMKYEYAYLRSGFMNSTKVLLHLGSHSAYLWHIPDNCVYISYTLQQSLLVSITEYNELSFTLSLIHVPQSFKLPTDVRCMWWHCLPTCVSLPFSSPPHIFLTLCSL